MKSEGKTDIGKKRAQNQDSIFYTDEPIGLLPNLYIVADGMGGHKAGDIASKTAIECVTEYVRESTLNNPVSVLKRAIIYANDKVYKLSRENEDYSGMGTTFVAAVEDEGILYVANIGDSRLYRIGDDIRQITLDHSLVEELIRTGQLDRNKGRNHPEKNIITKALGIGNDIVPDFFEINLSEGDKILLCSDGLTNMLEDDEIKEIVFESDGNLKNAVDKMIDRANYYGGKDNISVVLAVK
jgi:protein phosphatase